jgi:hypothetical protein
MVHNPYSGVQEAVCFTTLILVFRKLTVCFTPSVAVFMPQGVLYLALGTADTYVISHI